MFGFGGHFGRGMGGGGKFGGPPFAHFRHRFGGGCGPFAMLSDLDLTDEQLERLAELKLEGMSQWAQLKVSLGGLMKQLVRELCGEQINKTKIKELAKQIQEKKAQAGDEFLDRIIIFAEVLTPEQRKKVRMKAIKRFLGIWGEEHQE
jgi:Spy/CpxP family protein refolding chaperone